MSFCQKGLLSTLLLSMLATCSNTFATTYHVEQRATAADDLNDGSESHPWKTISRAAATIAPGDTVVIGDGIYHEAVTIACNGTTDKPIRFEAAPAATVLITGANRITRWIKEQGDANIFSTSWGYDFIPWNATHTHPNDDFHLLIGRCEQMMVAGQPLRQVIDRQHLARGTFLVDLATKRLYAWSADNRNLANENLICEASARSVLWDCRGDHVQTAGLRFRYAANVAQRGAAVFSGKHDVVEDCIFENTNSVGATFLNDDIVARHCIFRNNGQLGFAADRAHRLIMTDCIISNNNTKGFNRAWEAGGDKLVLCRDVVIERSIFEQNHGTGIWFDIGNENCTVRNCLIADNEDAGLFYEISYGLHAHDNVISGNGLADTPGAWGVSSGISLSSSPGCLIERNLLVGNKEGFSFREASRVTPRIDSAKEAPPEPIWNHDEVIRHNLLAYNHDAQVRGWFDVDDERHWPASMQEHKSASISPQQSLESLKFQFCDNVFTRSPGKNLLIWGASWNRNKAYDSLDEIHRELGFENGSTVEAITFQNYAERDFRVSPGSCAITSESYPHGEIPGVRIGTIAQ